MDNTSRLCDHCRTKPREGYSRYCRRCKTHKHEHGHPAGRSIPLRNLWMELQEIDVLMDRCRGSAALTAVINWGNELLRDAQLGRKVPAKRQLRHLADMGCRGEEIIRIVLALFYYSYRKPAALPSDDRLTFALANHIIKLRPLEQRTSFSSGKKVPGNKGRCYTYTRGIGSTPRRELGEKVRKELSHFLSNGLEWLLRQEDKMNRRITDMKAALPEKEAEPVSKKPVEGEACDGTRVQL